MANKIGVYLDKSNIGGGLDIEALADGLRKKWGELLGVVKVVPVLAESVEEVSKDIAEQDLDGVLLCGASPRVASHLITARPSRSVMSTCANNAFCAFQLHPTIPFPLPCWSKWRGITSIWELSGCKKPA